MCPILGDLKLPLVTLILILGLSVLTHYLENGLTDSIQIWHVVVTGIEGVSYFKVTSNFHVQKNYVEFYFFYFSIEYAEDNLRNFLQVFHIYVTGHG